MSGRAPDENSLEVVEVTALSSDGSGVARAADGRVVFVHRTAPGDRVRIRILRRKRRWARGEVVDLLEQGEGRREPPCPFYARCGGCTLEHLEYPVQLAWKGRFVADALERIGRTAMEAPEVVPSPRETRYRSRVSFALRRLPGGRVVAGFHELERPDRIVDVDGGCLLPVEEVAAVWDRLRAAWGPGAGRLPPGRDLRLTLRHADGGVALVIQGGGRGDGAPGALVEEVEGLTSVWREEEGEQGSRRMAGTEAVETGSGERLPVRGAAFLQVNRDAAEALRGRVLEAAGDVDGRSVVDAYCGVGVYGRALARRGARVTGIERHPDAVDAAVLDAPAGFRVLAGAVEERLPEATPADVVILNPPRGGLHERVPDLLRAAAVPRVVYVSCDPATLARDVGRLRDSYRLGRLDAFDLFPQTSHVESVAVLEWAAGEPRGNGSRGGA